MAKRDEKSLAHPKVKAGPGRPKGSKNKTTLFKETMARGFERSLRQNFQEVLGAVIKKAKDGDMKAAKLLLDRVVPVSKAVDMNELKKGGLTINISVGEMNQSPEIIEGTIVPENKEGEIDA